MIKEMSGLKNFDYQVSEPAKSALIKKQSAAPNPDRLAYESNVKQPAGKIFQDFAPGITEVLPGRAWVVPDMLTAEECEDWVRRGEASGLERPKDPTNRTSSRTQYYVDAEMTALIRPRFPEELMEAVRATAPETEVHGIHDNWKIARYQAGQAFPAHFDQDSYDILPPNDDGVKERVTSSHTILLYLAEDFTAGATRFFPSGNYNDPAEAVDIRLPKGGMLVFQQLGTLHAGLPIDSGTKYIAQTGLLRRQPEGFLKPAVFTLGPGLKNY